MKTSDRPEVQRFARHVNPRLVAALGVLGQGRLFTRAQGERLEDHRGNSYLDALAGAGSVALGHHAERLRIRFERALEEEPWGEHEGPRAHELKARLAARSGLAAVLLASSGAEAADAAMRLARASSDRHRLLSLEGASHGLSLAALSLAGDLRPQRPFAPLLPGCQAIPFGDLAALEEALDPDDVAALFLEPIQVEGGLRPLPPGYLAAARSLCHRHGALLVLDETQTGLGRCGHDFSWQAEGVKPDIMLLGRALGGSYCALSAVLTSPAVLARARRRAPGVAGAGPVAGVNVASAVALELLDALDSALLRSVQERGEELRRALQERLSRHPLVREVRGRGLLVGVELGLDTQGWKLPLPASVPPPPLGHWVALELLEKGVLCQPAAHRPEVLRLAPPLTISAADVAVLVDRVDLVMQACDGASSVLSALLWRLGRQARAGWTF
jgi:putrescine aminotransferase